MDQVELEIERVIQTELGPEAINKEVHSLAF